MTITPEQLKAELEYRDGVLIRKIKRTGAVQIGDIAGTIDKKGYRVVRVFRKTLRAHRIVWEMFNGAMPTGMQIDHIDGNRDNNRIENLRLADNSKNQQNRQLNKNSTSKIKGVSFHKRDQIWTSRVQINKIRFEKRFATKIEAELWSTNLRKFLHGSFVNNGVHKCNLPI